MKSFLKLAGWIAAILLGAVVFWKSALWAGSLPDLFRTPGADSKNYRDFEKAGKDLYGLMDAVRQAEETRDRTRYMEVVGVAAAKSLEADAAWERWQADENAARRGLRSGLEQGMFEYWGPDRFSASDKLEMLARSRGMDPALLRYLKAQLEILFQDEYLEKYGRPEQVDTPAAESAGADEGAAAGSAR